MKIVMPFGPTHRDDGGPFYIRKFCPPEHTIDIAPVDRNIPWKEYDACLCVDWAQDALGNWPIPAPPKDMPSVSWMSDTHMNPAAKEWRFRLSDNFRVPVFYHPEAVGEYRESRGREARWMPAAVDTTVYTPPLRDYTKKREWGVDPGEILRHCCGVIPRYDVGWVGHIGNPARDAFLDRMFREFPGFVFYSGGVFFEMASYTFSQCKVVLNHSVRGDLNMRTFEVLGSRSFLLTDRQRGMDDLGLKDGEHCAMYGSEEEAVEMCRWYMAHDGVRARIADAGWRWVLEGHTYWHRARALISLLGQ